MMGLNSNIRTNFCYFWPNDTSFSFTYKDLYGSKYGHQLFYFVIFIIYVSSLDISLWERSKITKFNPITKLWLNPG